MTERDYEYIDEDDFLENEDDDYEEYDDGHEDAMLRAFDAFSQDVNAEVERTQNNLGRRLTMAEKEAVAHQAIEQAARGQDFDIQGSLEAFYKAQGRTPLDMNTTAGRAEYMTERMSDMNPSPVVDEDRAYDLDDPKDRTAFMQARMQGAEFEDVEDDYA